jgi:long-chain acyl-CoA synthetase
MNLALALEKSAQRDPAKTALFWGGSEFSYGTLWSQSLGVAGRLRSEFGVRAGDRVGLWLKNCPEFVPALFGILQAGAVVVPINNFLKPAEIFFILADAGIDLIILDESMREGFEKLQAGRPGLRVFGVEAITAAAGVRPSPAAASHGFIEGAESPPLPHAAHSAAPAAASDSGEECQRSESDLAIIIYTSGTTGHPKGAMLSHGNLLANVQSCIRVLEAVGEDRFVVLLPMFHSFMLTVGVLLPLLVGGSIVLIKTLHPPKSIVAEIIQHRATLLPAVPQFFRALTHGSVPVNLPLRLCISGGAPLPAEILREFTARFPIPLLEGYGLSEASPVVSFNPIHGPWKAGSIGVPIFGVEVSVQDDSGKILPPGATGEVCVRGENVMLGYWQQPEETAKVMRQGWLLTGDIGHVDADGYFYITDRKKDLLIVNGINVYPREIEEVLYKFPGVKEAAVIGVPDARRGEQPMAFVAAQEGIVLQEGPVLHFVREQLADYKVPRHIVFLPALPRNATGKILKTELRKVAAAPS